MPQVNDLLSDLGLDLGTGKSEIKQTTAANNSEQQEHSESEAALGGGRAPAPADSFRSKLNHNIIYLKKSRADTAPARDDFMFVSIFFIEDFSRSFRFRSS